MEEIRKKVKKAGSSSRIIGIVLLILFAVGIQLIWNMDLIKYMTTSQDVSQYVKHWDEDSFYTCNTNMLVDYYASDDEGYYFFNLIGDEDTEPVIMGFYVYNEDVDLAMRMVDENAVLEEGYTDTYIKGRGLVYRMSTQEKQFMREYFGEELADYEDYLVYETFVLISGKKAMGASSIISIVISIAMLGIAIYLIFSLATGRCMKKFEQAMSDYHISENALAMDMATAEKIANVEIGNQHLIAYTDNSEVIPFGQLIWAYMHVQTTQHMMYGVIPTGKTVTHSLHFITKDKKKREFQFKDEATCQEILKKLVEKAPHAIIGYDEQLSQMYKNDFNQMIQIVEERKNNLGE